MEWMQAQDPMVAVPDDYVMMARVSVLLRGISSAFGMRLSTAPTWAPVAEKLLKEQAPERWAAVVRRREARAAAAGAAGTPQPSQQRNPIVVE